MAKTLQEQYLNNGLTLAKRQTTPPARYSESTLIKKLEATGVGRPSTYATIVETVLSQSRGYCTLVDKQMVPTERGIALIDFLDRNFSNLINMNYTKQMEEELDKIAEGTETKLEFLTSFYNILEATINSCTEIKAANIKTDKVCPNCGQPLVMRRSRYGRSFYGCKGYPNCTYTEKLD